MSLSSRSRAAEEKRKKKEEEERSSRKTGENFNKGVEAAKKAMTPAQRRAYEKSLGKSKVAATRRKKEDEFLESGGKKSRDYANPQQTFAQKFAAERAAQGPGGTFKWKNPRTGKTDTFTTDRADDKPASNGSGSNGSGNNKSENKQGGFFKNLGKKIEKATTLTPGRPRKPRGKVGMNSPQMRKYRADMKKWRESQDKKAAGGRVVAKKAAKKKAAKKKAAKKVARKKTMARTSVKKKSPRRP